MARPSVGIGLGIDWGSVSASAAGLAIEATKGYNDYLFSKKANLLNQVGEGYKRDLEQALYLGDFQTAENIRTQYSSVSKDILGYDPDKETPYFDNGRRLQQQYQSTLAEVDAYVEKEKRGWTDEILSSNTEQFLLGQEKRILEGSLSLEDAQKEINELYSGISNGLPMNASIPESGYSVGTRRTLTAIQKKYNDLLEMDLKAKAGQERPIDIAGERARGIFRLSALYYEEAEQLSKTAAEARQAGQFSQAKELETQALARFQKARQQQEMAYALLNEASKEEIKSTIQLVPTGVGSVYLHSEALNELESAMKNNTLDEYHVSGGRLKPEVVTALLDAASKRNSVISSDIGSSISTFQKLNDQALDKGKKQVDVATSEASVRLKDIDETIKKLNENDPRRIVLEQDKIRITHDLKKNLRSLVFSSLSSQTKARPSVMDLFGVVDVSGSIKNPFKIKETALNFSSESLDILGALEPNTNAFSLYSHAIEKVNAVLKEAITTPGGSSSGKIEDMESYKAFLAGKQGVSRLSESKKDEYSIRAAKESLGFTENDPFPRLDEALQREANPEVPFTMSMLIRTPWWEEIMVQASSKSSPDEAAKYLEDTFAKLITKVPGQNNIRWDDLRDDLYNSYAGGTTWAETVVRNLIGDDEKNQDITRLLFLYLPKMSRKRIVASLGENKSPRARTIELVNKLYDEKEPPNEFLAANPTLSSGFADPYIQEIKSARAISAVRNPDDNTKRLLNRQEQQKKVEDAVLAGIQLPGYTDRQNQTLNTALLLELRDLIDLSTVQATLGDEGLPEKFSQDHLEKIVRRVNQYVDAGGYSYKNNQLVKTAIDTKDDDGKTTIIPQTITGAAGKNVPPNQRDGLVLSSLVKQEKPKDPMLFLEQTGSPKQEDEKLFGVMNPLAALVVLGVRDQKLTTTERIQSINNSNDVFGTLSRIVTKSSGNMPQDNYTVLSMMAAIGEMPQDITSEDDAIKFVQDRAKEIRNSLERGTGNYKVEVREVRSNRKKSGNHMVAGISIVSNGKTVATLQPNTTSVTELPENTKVFKQDFDPVEYWRFKTIDQPGGALTVGSDFERFAPLPMNTGMRAWNAVVGDLGDVDVDDAFKAPLSEHDAVVADYMMEQDGKDMSIPVASDFNPSGYLQRIVFVKKTEGDVVTISKVMQRSEAWPMPTKWFNDSSYEPVTVKGKRLKERASIGIPDLLQRQEETNLPPWTMDLYGDLPDFDPSTFVPEEEMPMQTMFNNLTGQLEQSAIENSPEVRKMVEDKERFENLKRERLQFSTSLNKTWMKKQPHKRVPTPGISTPETRYTWKPFTVVMPNLPIELAKQHPNLPVSEGNPVKTVITYDKESRTWALVPDLWGGDTTLAESNRRKSKRQFGIFTSREEAELFRERLEEFLSNNN